MSWTMSSLILKGFMRVDLRMLYFVFWNKITIYVLDMFKSLWTSCCNKIEESTYISYEMFIHILFHLPIIIQFIWNLEVEQLIWVSVLSQKFGIKILFERKGKLSCYSLCIVNKTTYSVVHVKTPIWCYLHLT